MMSKSLEEALEKIDVLIERLFHYVQKETKEGQARELLGWYAEVWQGRTPEGYDGMHWQNKVKKVLRELIALCEKKRLTLVITGEESITHYKSLLPIFKGSDLLCV